MKKNMRTWIFVLVLLLVACTSEETSIPTSEPTQTTELEAVSLQFNWVPTVDFLGFYVALGKGFYAEEGLAVTLKPLSDSSSDKPVPEQVADGESDYAAGTWDLLLAQSKGAPLVTFGNIYKLGPTAFFTRTETGIQTPEDFAGHTVVIKSAAWQSLLEILLETGGLTLDDVELVEGSFDMSPFLEGKVDVWAGFLTDEAVRARQAGLELVTFPLYEYGVRSTPVTLYTTQEHLNNQPEQAERLLRASIRGWQWAIDNPEDAIDLFLEMNPELDESREFHLAAFQAGIPLIIPPGKYLGDIDCDVWTAREEIANLEARENLCTTKIFEAVSSNK